MNTIHNDIEEKNWQPVGDGLSMCHDTKIQRAEKLRENSTSNRVIH